MIDTEEQIEFDDVLREIEVGVDISEGNYDILRYYRDEYKDLLAEVERLRALADALFNLIPSHLSTEATDVWNEHMGDD